jgi:hypothetical protein
MLKALLGVLASLIVAVVVSSNAHAQDMSAELEQFNATCFTEAGEFEPTDGCYEYAESIGIEIDNINESMDKGCVLSDLLEDYSCKGPSAPSSSFVSEQEEVSEQCFTVDVSDTDEVSEQEVAALQLLGFYSFPDGSEQLYAPQCAHKESIGAFPDETAQFILESECFDVVGTSYEDAAIEYIGCPEADSVDDEAYRPVTQQGTLAPSDWPAHVVPLKRASSYKPAEAASKPSSSARPTTSTLSTTNPYVVHRDGDTGRSQGQVVSESKRAGVSAKASTVQAKVAATEKAKKAQSKKK